MIEDAPHAFVVPAFGHSPHLGECLRSLLDQEGKPSEIVVATSTPTPEVESLCKALDVKLVVHGPNTGIANDWNMAIRASNARFVTIAHQDDLYYPGFARRSVAALESRKDVLLTFTDYDELEGDTIRNRNKLLWIKQLLLHAAFLGRARISDKFSKLNSVRFACPIPCPSVTLNRSLLFEDFDSSFQINLDWNRWVAAAKQPGSFVWIRETLMGHRIHEGSETSAAILDGRRAIEDRRVLNELWPAPIAALISRTFSLAYASNRS